MSQLTELFDRLQIILHDKTAEKQKLYKNNYDHFDYEKLTGIEEGLCLAIDEIIKLKQGK